MTRTRRDLLAFLDDIRDRVNAGEIEAIAVVLITDTQLLPGMSGEPQSMATLHMCGPLLSTHINAAIEESCEDDDELELGTLRQPETRKGN